MLDINVLLGYQNIIMILAVVLLIEALKKTATVLKFRDSLWLTALLPWLPMVLGAALAAVPGVVDGKTLTARLVMGVALGGISGQVWKIIKTKLEVFGGGRGQDDG